MQLSRLSVLLWRPAGRRPKATRLTGSRCAGAPVGKAQCFERIAARRLHQEAQEIRLLTRQTIQGQGDVLDGTLQLRKTAAQNQLRWIGIPACPAHCSVLLLIATGPLQNVVLDGL